MTRRLRASGPVLALLLAAVAAVPAPRAQHAPLRLHPENPHYFLFRGRPTIVITSGEHYGALLNLDFDYRKYLDTLARDGMNGTRTFAGAYVETEGNFNITRNTLNPAAGRFIAPWARSGTPGYADGGNRFDLTRWDEAYFARLRDFVAHASRRGVIVELNLFTPMYQDSMWSVNPMNARNNVNGLGEIGRDDVLTLDRSGGLLAVQEAMVRRIVHAVREFDNVYFEVCNEPYATGVPDDWHRHMASVIDDAMRDFPVKFLISHNYANGSARVTDPHPAVSIYNFHYASPPDAVALNYDLGRLIGDNETGFRGTADAPYRTEAWDFIVAGGGLFNHLDYSFAVGHEDGTKPLGPGEPGGGGPELRRQFGVLRDFINGFDFVKMRPAPEVVVEGPPSPATLRILAEPGRAYAGYLRRFGAAGEFSVRWTGVIVPPATAEYTFATLSNDGVRLRIDGATVVENWTDHGQTEDTGRVRLEAGRRHAIVLEYFYAGGEGAMRLRWSAPGLEKQPVPASALTTADGRPGLAAEYFRDIDLKRPWFARTDAHVNFATGPDWPVARPTGRTGATVRLRLPAGRWRAAWIDPLTGRDAAVERFEHAGGERTLTTPDYADDLALAIRRP